MLKHENFEFFPQIFELNRMCILIIVTEMPNSDSVLCACSKFLLYKISCLSTFQTFLFSFYIFLFTFFFEGIVKWRKRGVVSGIIWTVMTSHTIADKCSLFPGETSSPAAEGWGCWSAGLWARWASCWRPPWPPPTRTGTTGAASGSASPASRPANSTGTAGGWKLLRVTTTLQLVFDFFRRKI